MAGRSLRLRRLAIVGAVVAVALCGQQSWLRARVFRNNESIWLDTIAKNPEAWMAHNNYGTLLLSEGRVDEAIDQLLWAVEIRPGSAMIRLNLSAALIRADRKGQAMDQLQQHNMDLIVLDLRMPGPVDGEQLLFALRDQGNDVPVVVLSGWVDDGIRDAPPDCVRAVLKKPIKIDSFVATVDSVLGEPSATTSS